MHDRQCAGSNQTKLNSDTDVYFVTAVYDRGESVGSNTVCLAETSISAIEDENGDTTPTEFFNMHGMRVNAKDMAPGVYIRRKGQTVEKVVIK